MIMINPAKVGPSFHSFRRSGDGSERAFSHLKPGSLSSLGPGNIISRGSFGSSCRLSVANYSIGGFAKRFFSQVPHVTSKLESVGAQNGKYSVRTSFFKQLSKRRKREKALAAQSKNEATVSSISKDVDVEASTEQQIISEKGDGKLGSFLSKSPIINDNQVPKVKVKKRSKGKKTKEQISAANAPAEAAATQSSKGTSQTKKSGSTKSGKKSAQDSEVSNYKFSSRIRIESYFYIALL